MSMMLLCGRGGAGELLPFRRNAMTNPSVEEDDTGWSFSYGSETISLDTTTAASGTASLKVITDATDGEPNGVVVDGTNAATLIPVEPDQTWTVSIAAKGEDPSPAELDLTVRLHHSGGYSTFIPIEHYQLTTDWVRHGVTFTVPDDNDYDALALFYELRNDELGKTFWLDALLIEETDQEGTYFDGDTAGYEWTGSSHASASQTAGY